MGGFPVSASSSRTPVAEEAGGRTQLVGVPGAVLLIVFILIAPGLTGYLPPSTLAAVVIVAAAGLIEIRSVVHILKVDRTEGLLSISAFLGVALIGVLQGTVIAVGLSFVAFVNQAWRPHRAELGQIPTVRGHHDRSRHPDAERLPGIVIVRFDAPLFFTNGGMFDDYVRSLVADAGPDVRTVILAAEPITDIDTTAVDELIELDDFLASRGTELIIAEMKGPVKDRLRAFGLGDRFGPDRFEPTVGAAVDQLLDQERDDIGHPSDRPSDRPDEATP